MANPKYARFEDERRFLVSAVPADASAPRHIEDRYLLGTRLRLRAVIDGDGTVRKLGQKVREDPQRPSSVWHTTLYLDQGEFERLGALPARTLTKRRWSLPDGGAADEFGGPLDGLVLLEGPRPFAPAVVGVEVTDDERFSGGALAALDPDAAAAFVMTAHRQLHALEDR
jgi:CYTH domain-containing protein